MINMTFGRRQKMNYIFISIINGFEIRRAFVTSTTSQYTKEHWMRWMGTRETFLHQVKYQHWLVAVNCFIIRFEMMEENSFQLPVGKVG